MKLIVLDAGDSFELDGFNKLLIRHPITKKTILDTYIHFFNPSEIEIVVGYRAMDVMTEYPNLNYIFNSKWQTTNNSYSLSLSLTETPCYIISSDLFINEQLLNKLKLYDNCLVAMNNENKKINSLNVTIKHGKPTRIYKGKSQSQDYELAGIFKITDVDLLKDLKKQLIAKPDLYVAENISNKLLKTRYNVVITDIDEVYEINNSNDYISFLKRVN